MQVVCWADVTRDDPKHALMIMEVYPEVRRRRSLWVLGLES